MDHNFFMYNPETKYQSMDWKNSPWQKTAQISKSKFTVMMIVFFFGQPLTVYIIWVLESSSKPTLHWGADYRSWMRKKTSTWFVENQSWNLHQDNALSSHSLSVKRFLAKHCILVLEHTPHSMDLALCEIQAEMFYPQGQISFERKSNRNHEQPCTVVHWKW